MPSSDHIVQLAFDYSHCVAPLYTADRNDVAVHAVLTGRSPGRVYADDAARPRVAVVWSPIQGYYFGGDPNTPRLVAVLNRFLDQVAIPLARERGEDALDMSGADASWDAVLDRLLASRHPQRSIELGFRLRDASRWLGLHAPVELPEGLRLMPIDVALYPRVHDDEGHPLADHWCGYEAFEAAGLGYCLLDAWGHIVSTCAAGFGADGWVEATVSTAEGSRRQGLATITASAFVRGALARGWTPVWHCMGSNRPSARLARKLGFVRVGRTTLYSFWF